jgi:uncharacterized protein YeaO (DUF488 family)
MILVKRVYTPPDPADGTRVLVERLWPRGISKERAQLDLWLKEISPSPSLRQWFAHDPEKWDEFRRRYWGELEQNQLAVGQLRDLLKQGTLTLIYAARDEQHNSALILKAFLDGSS